MIRIGRVIVGNVTQAAVRFGKKLGRKEVKGEKR